MDEWEAARQQGLEALQRRDLAAARRALESALDLAPPSEVREAHSLVDLADFHADSGTLDEAEALLVRAIRLLQPLGAEHLDGTSAALTRLAQVLQSQRRTAEAEGVLNRAWVITMAGTASPLHFYEVAEANHPCRLFRAAVRAARIHLRPEAALVAYAGRSRAIFQLYPDGHTRLRKGIPLIDPDGNPSGLILAEPLGPTERAWLEEMSEAMTARLKTLPRSLDPGSEVEWDALRQRGLKCLEEGRIDQALTALEGALNVAELWGLTDARVGRSLNALAQLYVATRRPGDARECLRRALDVLEPLPGHKLELAATLTQLGRLVQDESLLDRAWVLTMQADARPSRRKAEPAAPVSPFGRATRPANEPPTSTRPTSTPPQTPAPLAAPTPPPLAPTPPEPPEPPESGSVAAYRQCVLNLGTDLRADRVLVLINEGSGLAALARSGFPDVPLAELPVSHALLRHLSQTGAPLLLSDARQGPPGISVTGVRSLACAPVWTPEGEVHGLLYADLLEGNRGFSRRDMQSLQLRARQLEEQLFVSG